MQLEFTKTGDAELLKALDAIVSKLTRIESARPAITINANNLSATEKSLREISARSQDLSKPVNLKVQAQTSGSENTILNLGKITESVGKSIDRLNETLAKMQTQTSATATGTQAISTSMRSVGAETETAAKSIEKTNQALSNTVKTSQVTGQNTAIVANQMQRLADASNIASANNTTMSQSMQNAGKQATSASSSVQNAGKSIQATEQSTRKAVTAFTVLASVFRGVKAGASMVVTGISSIWKVAGAIDRFTYRFAQMTKVFYRLSIGAKTLGIVLESIRIALNKMGVLPESINKGFAKMNQVLITTGIHLGNLDSVVKNVSTVFQSFGKVGTGLNSLKRAMTFQDGIKGLLSIPTILIGVGRSSSTAARDFSALEERVKQTSGGAVDLRETLKTIHPAFKWMSTALTGFTILQNSIKLATVGFIGMAAVAPQTFQKMSSSVMKFEKVSSILHKPFRGIAKGAKSQTISEGGEVINVKRVFQEIPHAEKIAAPFKAASEMIQSFWNTLGTKIGTITSKFTSVFPTISSALSKVKSSVIDVAKSYGGWISNLPIFGKMSAGFRSIVASAKLAGTQVVDTFAGAKNYVNEKTAPLREKIKPVQDGAEKNLTAAGKGISGFGKGISDNLTNAFTAMKHMGVEGLHVSDRMKLASISAVGLTDAMYAASIPFGAVRSIIQAMQGDVSGAILSFVKLNLKMGALSLGAKAVQGVVTVLSDPVMRGVLLEKLNEYLGRVGLSAVQLGTLFSSAFKSIVQAVEFVVTKLGSLFSRMGEGLEKSKGGQILATMFKSVGAVIGAIGMAVKGVFGGIIGDAAKSGGAIGNLAKMFGTLKEKATEAKDAAGKKIGQVIGGARSSEKAASDTQQKTGRFKIPGLETVTKVFTDLYDHAQKVASYLSKQLTAAVEAVTNKIKELGKVAFGESVFPDMKKWILDVAKSLSTTLTESINAATRSLKKLGDSGLFGLLIKSLTFISDTIDKLPIKVVAFSNALKSTLSFLGDIDAKLNASGEKKTVKNIKKAAVSVVSDRTGFDEEDLAKRATVKNLLKGSALVGAVMANRKLNENAKEGAKPVVTTLPGGTKVVSKKFKVDQKEGYEGPDEYQYATAFAKPLARNKKTGAMAYDYSVMISEKEKDADELFQTLALGTFNPNITGRSKKATSFVGIGAREAVEGSLKTGDEVHAAPLDEKRGRAYKRLQKYGYQYVSPEENENQPAKKQYSAGFGKFIKRIDHTERDKGAIDTASEKLSALKEKAPSFLKGFIDVLLIGLTSIKEAGNSLGAALKTVSTGITSFKDSINGLLSSFSKPKIATNESDGYTASLSKRKVAETILGNNVYRLSSAAGEKGSSLKHTEDTVSVSGDPNKALNALMPHITKAIASMKPGEVLNATLKEREGVKSIGTTLGYMGWKNTPGMGRNVENKVQTQEMQLEATQEMIDTAKKRVASRKKRLAAQKKAQAAEQPKDLPVIAGIKSMKDSLSAVFATIIRHAKRAGDAIGNYINDGVQRAISAGNRLGDVMFGHSVLPDISKYAKQAGSSIGTSISDGAKTAINAVKQLGTAASPGTFNFTGQILEGFKQLNTQIDASKKKMAELYAAHGPKAVERVDYQKEQGKIQQAQKAKQDITAQLARSPNAYAEFKGDVRASKEAIRAQINAGTLSKTQGRAQIHELESPYSEIRKDVQSQRLSTPSRLAKQATDYAKTLVGGTQKPMSDTGAGPQIDPKMTKKLMRGIEAEMLQLGRSQKGMTRLGQEKYDTKFGSGEYTKGLDNIKNRSNELFETWQRLAEATKQVTGSSEATTEKLKALYAGIFVTGDAAQKAAKLPSGNLSKYSPEEATLQKGAMDRKRLKELHLEQQGMLKTGKQAYEKKHGVDSYGGRMAGIAKEAGGIGENLAKYDAELRKLGSTKIALTKNSQLYIDVLKQESAESAKNEQRAAKDAELRSRAKAASAGLTGAIAGLLTVLGKSKGDASQFSEVTDKMSEGMNKAGMRSTFFGSILKNLGGFAFNYARSGNLMKAGLMSLGQEFLGVSNAGEAFIKTITMVMQSSSGSTNAIDVLKQGFLYLRDEAGKTGTVFSLVGKMLGVSNTDKASESTKTLGHSFSNLKKVLFDSGAAFKFTQVGISELVGGKKSLLGQLALMHPALAGVIAAWKAYQIVGRQIIATLRDILNIGGKVQTQLLRTQGLLAASDSGDAFGSLKDTIYELGAKTEFTTQQVAQASNALLQLGFSGKEAEGSLRAVIDAASANQIPLEQAAEAAANTIRQFGLNSGNAAKDAEDALGALSAVAFNTGADISSLQMAMRNVGPTAQILGLEVGEAAAVLGTFGNVAIRYGRAGTNLNNILSRMATQPAPARKAFQALGIEVAGGDGKFRKFSDIIGDVSKKFAGMTDAQKATYAKMIAGQRSMAAFLTLVDTGKDKLDELTEKTKTGADINKKMAEDFRAGWEGSVAALQSAIEGVKLTAFDILSRGATGLVKVMTGLVTMFNKALIAFKNFAMPVIDLTSEVIETLVDLTKVSVGLAVINPFPTLITGAAMSASSVSKVSASLGTLLESIGKIKGGAPITIPIITPAFQAAKSAAKTVVSGGASRVSQAGGFVAATFTKLTGSSKLFGKFAALGTKAGGFFTKNFTKVWGTISKSLGINLGSLVGLGKIIGQFAVWLKWIQLILIAWKLFKDQIMTVVKVLQIGFQVIDIVFKLVLKSIQMVMKAFGSIVQRATGWKGFDINGSLDKTIKILDDVQKAIDSWSIAEFETKFVQMMNRIQIAAIRAMADVIKAASGFGEPKEPEKTLDENGHLIVSDTPKPEPQRVGVVSKTLGWVGDTLSTGIGFAGKHTVGRLGKKTSESMYDIADAMEYNTDNRVNGNYSLFRMHKDEDRNIYGDQGISDPEAEAARRAQEATAKYQEQVSQMKFGREQKKESRRSTVSIYMEWMKAEVGSEKWTELDQQLKARSSKTENMLSAYYMQQGEILQKTMDAFAAKGVDIPTDSATYAAIAQVIREKGSITAEGLKSLGVAIPEQDALEADLLEDLKKFTTNIKKLEADGAKATTQDLQGLNIPKEIRGKVLEWMRTTNVDTISAEDFKTLGITFPDAEKLFQDMVDSLQNTKLTSFEAWVKARPKIHITMEQAAAIDEKIVGMQEAKEDREKKLIQAKSTWELMLELETVDLNSDAAFNILTELELRKDDEDFEGQLAALGEDIQTTYAERIEQIKQLADEQRVTARKRATDKLKSRSSVDLAIEMEGLDPNSVEFAQAANEIMGRGEGEMGKAQAAAQRVFEIDLQVKKLEDVKSAKDATLSLADAVLAVRDKADAIGQIDLAAKLRVEEIGLKVRQFLIEPFDQFKDKIGEIKGKFADMIQGIQGKRIDIKEKLGLYGSEAEQGKLFGLQQKLRDAKSEESKEAINKQIEKQREKMGINEQASGERLGVLTQREGILKQELQLAGTDEKKASLSEKLADLLFQKSDYATSASEGKMFGQEAIFATQQAEQFAMSAQRKAIEKEKLQKESDLKQKGILTGQLETAQSPEAKASILEKLIPIVEKGGELGSASEMVRLNEELSAAVVKKAEEQVAREKETLDIQKESLQIQRLQLERLQLILDKNVEAVQNQKEKKPGAYNAQPITLNGGTFTNVS